MNQPRGSSHLKAAASRIPHVATATILAALIASGAAGCAGPAEPTAPRPPTTKATSTPKPQAESTPKAEPLTGELPENLKPYESISLEEFAALDKDEVQLPYFAALAGGIDGIRRFAMSYAGYTQDPGDALPKEISENNSLDEIAAVVAYGNRMLMGLEPEDRLKAAVAILQGGQDSPRWPVLSDALNQNADHSAMPGATVAYYEFSTLPEIVSGSELITDAATGLRYRDLIVKGPDGQEQQSRAYYHSVTVGNQTFNWWTGP